MSALAGTGLRVRLGDRDVTALVQRLSFSAVDPGGYESATLELPATAGPISKGDTLAVLDGVGDVWWGRVEEPGSHTSGGRTSYSVQAIGAGAALKDNTYACVYVDRDISQWRGASRDRRISLGSGYSFSDPQAITDTQSGAPVLALQITGSWDGSHVPLAEAAYDAGPLCSVSFIYYEPNDFLNIAASDTNWYRAIVIAANDAWASLTNTRKDEGITIASGFYGPRASNRTGQLDGAGRLAVVQLQYNGGASATEGITYQQGLRTLAVYGDHNLPLRGPAPGGFYPSDIVRHALAQTDGILPGAISESGGYIVPHAVYKEPTTPEQVIDDMAKVVGWHWGVWGPDSVLDDRPRLHFRPPPSEATVACSRLLAEDFQIADQLSTTYDGVVVGYQDAAGTRFYETVTQPNDTLPDRLHRTGQVDIGTSTQAGARSFGLSWLLLTQRAQRSGGQCTLPAEVITPSGARRRALTLKPGLDRLRFTDLPSDGQNLLDADTRRFDTFRLKRVETSIEDGGVPRTRVEFDTGANLIEVMQARLDAATKIATG